jgi:hypothetical protein
MALDLLGSRNYRGRQQEQNRKDEAGRRRSAETINDPIWMVWRPLNGTTILSRVSVIILPTPDFLIPTSRCLVGWHIGVWGLPFRDRL